MSKELRLPFIVIGVYFLSGLALRPLDLDQTTGQIFGIILRLVLSLVLWRYVGSRIKEEYLKNNWLVGSVIGLLVIVPLYQKFGPGSASSLSFFTFRHLLYSLENISTGLFEELLCRVALFFAILKQVGKNQLWKAVIITSLFFAVFHFPNMFRPEGVNFSVINQVGYAFGVGLLLQSLFLRLRNLLLVVVLHGLANYWMGFSQLLEPVNSPVVYTATLSEVWSGALKLMLVVLLFCMPLSYVILKGGSRKL